MNTKRAHFADIGVTHQVVTRFVNIAVTDALIMTLKMVHDKQDVFDMYELWKDLAYKQKGLPK